MGELLNRARANGELSAEGLARFPQLVVAPLILAVVWDGLFAAIEPLNVEGLLAVHRELLLRGAGGRGEGQTGQGQSGKGGGRADMKRRLIVIGLLLLAAAGGGAWWWLKRPPEGGPIVLTGNVEVRQVNLGFKMPGRIQSLKVDEGDAVTEGQVLARWKRSISRTARAAHRASRSVQGQLTKMQAGNRPEEIAQAKSNVRRRRRRCQRQDRAQSRRALLNRAVGRRRPSTMPGRRSQAKARSTRRAKRCG